MVASKFNPFAPNVGQNPPLLVGRDELIADFIDGLGAVTAPTRVSLFSGVRGIGKTVLLNEIEAKARQAGWVVFTDNASPGFVERFCAAIARHLREHFPKADRRRLAGISIAAVRSVSFEPGTRGSAPGSAHVEAGLRQLLEELDTALAGATSDGKPPVDRPGILLSLDELHYGNHAEMVTFASAIQLVLRQDRNLAVMMAGIPSSVNTLLRDKVSGRPNPITFLRRADRHVLSAVSDEAVALGLDEPAQALGFSWESDALEAAVSACRGYPFMIQLVGYHTLRQVADGQTVITSAAAEAGIGIALRRLGNLVHEPALEDLSPTDRTFLVQMAKDEGESLVSDLGSRMNVSSQYVGRYRNRLIEAGMIEPAGYGTVRFGLPYLREYLREHAVYLAISEPLK